MDNVLVFGTLCQSDRRRRPCSINAVIFRIRCRRAVARRIRGRHARVDRQVIIRHQLTAWDFDREAQNACRIRHLTRVGRRIRAIDQR